MIAYKSTNESLRSIVNGLQPNKEDYILAICGSGDQAFALASKGAKVLAVDNDPIQLEYAKLRLAYLKEGNLGKFIDPKYFVACLGSYWDGPNKLFLLDSIEMSSFGEIEFKHGDIFNIDFDFNTFSKIYLSNAFHYSMGKKRYANDLTFLLNSLKKGGIIYTNGKLPIPELSLLKKIFRFPKELTLEEELTQIAHEDYVGRNWSGAWHPYVYKKK